MKIFCLAAIFLLLHTVQCKPTTESKTKDEDIYGPLLDDDVQNDKNNNEEDYGEGDYDPDSPDGEEERLPEEEPKILTTGAEFERTENETVEFPCKISGTSAVQIWRKNKQILFQSGVGFGVEPNKKILGNGSIEISNVKAKDAGEYECLALFKAEETSPKIVHTLKVRYPPQVENISIKDGNTVLRNGDRLELKCTASGYPPPYLTWHKGGKRLVPEGDTLEIDNVKHHDAGIYSCLADNKIGDPDFKTINITVEFKPVVIIEKISVSSDTSHDTELECIVRSQPKAQVIWKKDDKNIVSSDRFQLQDANSSLVLVIKGVAETDFGTYTCVAVNYLGETKKHVKLVKTPAILRFIKPKAKTEDVVLTWEVQSKSAINQHELQYKKKGEKSWKSVKPTVTPADDEIYTVSYTLPGLEPGTYETRVRSQNNHGWSEYSEIMPFEGEKHMSTQEDTQNTNQEDETPAEHQASGLAKESTPAVRASESSGATILSYTTSLISIAVIIMLRQ